MATTTYINFSAIDFTGVNTLSSYALPLTPILFVPDMPKTRDNRVIWNFGDGTETRSFSTNKVYEFPGVYNTTLIVYDCNSNAMISTINKTITIYDYVPFTFNITASEVEKLEIKCGHISGPLIINAYYPPYQTASNIYYSLTGSNSKNYWDTVKNKFGHLENFYSYYDTTYNYSISSYQYTPINKIVTNTTNLYAKIVGNSIVDCLSSDSGAVFVGMHGTKDIYFKDDSLSNLVLTKFWFDKLNNKIPSVSPTTSPYLNNLGITLSAKIIDNPASYLSITSNGVDGEGYSIDSFQINPIKYFNTKIPFVVKIKDIDNMSIKNFDSIPLSSLTITLQTIYDAQLVTENGEYLLDEDGNSIYATGIVGNLSSGDYVIESLNYTLSSQNSGGAFRGYISFNNLSTTNILQNVSLSASGTFISNQLSSYTLSGVSNKFNVYSQNYFDLYKNNEDFNASQTIGDLRFQETMLDKPILFDDFIGAVLGNADSTHETIGLKMYEKIANFVQNTEDIDACEQEYIDSLAQYMGYNDIKEEMYVYPERIKHIINLASIDKSKLMGETNKFNENLDIKGHTSKDEYGKNLGDQIDAHTYMVLSSNNIVALEKFGNIYSVLNTQQPMSATYPLSAYSSDWGWPLVLPLVFDFKDIDKYYIFFEYNPQYDNTVIGGIIDFTNPKNYSIQYFYQFTAIWRFWNI